MNIRQIAALSGVSVATVSRCINQPEKVSPKTQERILSVIAELQYKPNPSAQSLSTGQTHMVACVVPTLRNEFFNQLVEGCQKTLAKEGYQLLIYATNNDDDFWKNLNQRGVDGLVISGTDFRPELAERLGKITIPYVLIENSDEFENICKNPKTVYIEDYNGVQLALKHLYSQGNRCIGVVGFADDTFVTRRRIKAVENFFKKHADCTYYFEKSDYTDLEQSFAAAEALLKKTPCPTAIFTFNDMIAAGILRYLNSHNINVPKQMELVGFDDIPLASLLTPSLSTVAAPNRSLGEKAAEILLCAIRQEDTENNVIYPVELKLRESTRPKAFL